MSAAVVFEDVHKAFEGREVLRGISLEAPTGKTFVLLGPSGAGKSVFLRLLVGLIQADAGCIRIDGKDITHLDPRGLREMRKQMGMLFQHAALFDSMSVEDNVAFPLDRHLRISPGERRDRVARCLEMVDLPGIEKRMPAELSGGMRKRVGLARAIVMEPRLVLFDEPNSGLDPVTAGQIDDLIQRMQEELGSTFVIISHDIVGAFRVAHRIALLYKGNIVADEEPEALKRSEHPMVRTFLERDLA